MLLGKLTLGDVTNVALNDGTAILIVEIGHHLDLLPSSVLPLQR
jgi:hypothetical protein